MSDRKFKREADLSRGEWDYLPTINIVADFDHDGMIEQHPLPGHPGDRFAIVLPVPDMLSRPLHKYEEWQLMGGVNPVETGAVNIQLNGPLPKGSSLTLRVDEHSRGKVHLFRHRETQWEYMGSEGVWCLENIESQEVMLRLVAGSFAHASAQGMLKWSGDFTLTAAVVTGEGAEVMTDSARFQVAPFLLTSALDPVDEVLVIKNAQTLGFVDALQRIVPQTGAKPRIIQAEGGNESDVWIQDTVEIGRVCVPTPQGVQQAIVVLAGIRAKHHGIDCEPLDRYMRQYFANLGGIIVEAASPREGTRWIDWYGNLEVSPPVKAQNGREFPLGRILVGVQNDLGMHPDVLAFLETQRFQAPPLVIDTSWLLIGHVDEVVSFVPAPDQRGFRVLIPSTSLVKSILENVTRQGLGEQKVFANHQGETTVTELLEEVAMSKENDHIQHILDETRAHLCEGLGVDDNDFIEIPVLFKDGVAVIPNCVNGLICNGHVILPNPFGPWVDGEDAFATAIRVALTALGVKVHFVDNWEPYHLRDGEVHCGTNAIRRVRQPAWWNTTR